MKRRMWFWIAIALTLALSACGAPSQGKGTEKETAKRTSAEEQSASASSAGDSAGSQIDSSSADGQEALMEQVRAGNYKEAIKIYQEAIAGNGKEEAAAGSALKEYLTENWKAYQDKKISEDDMEGVLITLEKLDDQYTVIDNLYEFRLLFSLTKAARENYQNALALVEEGKYEEAILTLSVITPDDEETYRKAQEKLTEYKAAYQAQILAEMQAAAKEEQYLTVVRQYESTKTLDFIEVTADMTRLYTDSIAAYTDEVAGRAKTAFGENKDYEAAIGVVRKAIVEVTDTEGLVAKLEELIAEYQAYIPVAITTLSPTQINRVPGTTDSTYLWIGRDYYHLNDKDVNGESYAIDKLIGLNATYPPSKNEEDAYVTYNLNYQYSTLAGVVFRPYESLSCSFDWTKPGFLRIYGDGILLYESKAFTQEVYESDEVTVDVSGVRDLKIVLVGFWKTSNYDCYGKVAFGDVMLQK